MPSPRTPQQSLVIPLTRTPKKLVRRTGFHGFVACERASGRTAGVPPTFRAVSSYDSMLMAMQAINAIAEHDGKRKPRWPSDLPSAEILMTASVPPPIRPINTAEDDYVILYWPEAHPDNARVPFPGGVVDLSLAERTFEYTQTASAEAVETAQARAERGKMTPKEIETLPKHKRGKTERALDLQFADPTATHALPGAFKSWFAVERWGHTAHLKLDYDTKHENPTRRNEPSAEMWRETFRDLRNGEVWPCTDGQLHEEPIMCIPHEVAELRAYRTGRGLHVRVWLKMIVVMGSTKAQLPDHLLLALHARLNDDPVRQAFNTQRVARGAKGWCVLWCQKFVCGRLISQEKFSRKWTQKIKGWIAS